MGKNSKNKIQKLITGSLPDLADSYLKAKPVKAKALRLEAAYQYVKRITIWNNYTPMVDALGRLSSDFANAYMNLIGHMLFGIRHEEFWDDVAKDLHIITKGRDNEEALCSWGLVFDELTEKAIKAFCYSTLQGIARQDNPLRRHSFAKVLKEKSFNDIFYDAIPTHLVISSAIAQGKIIYKAGSLLLCYQGFAHEEAGELWLVKKRGDGIYSISSEAKDGTLRVSDVKAMRKFVSSYEGPLFKGGLCPGREKQAARICKAVGLHVDDTHAWMGQNAIN